MEEMNQQKEEWSFEKQYGFEPPRVVGAYMFVEIYKHKLSENLVIADSVKEMQKWTSNVGRVGKLAHGCFKGKQFEYWGEDEFPKIGDWITFKIGVADIFKYRGVDVAIMYDDALKSIIENPSYVTRD